MFYGIQSKFIVSETIESRYPQSKTVNNNNIIIIMRKVTSRPFASVSECKNVEEHRRFPPLRAVCNKML